MSIELFEKAKENLKSYWGFDDFRAGQDEVVKSILAGNETLVLFPTGGGSLYATRSLRPSYPD